MHLRICNKCDHRRTDNVIVDHTILVDQKLFYCSINEQVLCVAKFTKDKETILTKNGSFEVPLDCPFKLEQTVTDQKFDPPHSIAEHIPWQGIWL